MQRKYTSRDSNTKIDYDAPHGKDADYVIQIFFDTADDNRQKQSFRRDRDLGEDRFFRQVAGDTGEYRAFR
jgi:hypothetical protein